MLIRVYAQSPADFAAWVDQQKQPARQDFTGNPGGRGRPGRLHAQRLHQLPHDCGNGGDGALRADLTHLASRDTIASGAFRILRTT